MCSLGLLIALFVFGFDPFAGEILHMALGSVGLSLLRRIFSFSDLKRNNSSSSASGNNYFAKSFQMSCDLGLAQGFLPDSQLGPFGLLSTAFEAVLRTAGLPSCYSSAWESGL